MAAPTDGPCGPWIAVEDVQACERYAALDPVAIQDGIDFATGILFRMSGRRYPGECERTTRPCVGSNCGCDYPEWGLWPDGAAAWWGWFDGYALPSWPYRLDGEWFNTGCCGGRCDLPRVKLPGPVIEVTEVLIDGVALDPADYDVSGYRWLRRLDGERWPCWQDLTADPATDDNTFQVTYTYGRLPGPDGILAVRTFAGEYALHACGAESCLPQRVTSISREGVSVAFADPLEFLDENGRVGITEVDLWLKSANPAGLARRSTVRSMARRPRGGVTG